MGTSPKKTRHPILGIWQHIPLPMISRYLGLMGWEWVILDMQHSAASSETAYECMHVLRTAGAKPLVRTGVGQPGEIERALDLGAMGVIVPMVNSAAEAQRAAQAAKYPPLGRRSMGSDATWHQGSGFPERANEETLLLVQIEHIDAVREVEAIMATPGVDGCFLGPTDLALSLGLPRVGFESDPRHQAAIARTLEACQAAGKLACSNTYSLAEAAAKLAQGFDAITFMSEADLLMSAGRELLGTLRTARDEAGSQAAAD
jgi:4-hydroxy-2-oxoheptanedioate aldolase